jgi:hypothetical protein
MRKVAVVGVCLLLGLVAGLLLRPDDGTQVSISPVESGAVVSGANHAKPLPRVPTPVVDIVRDLMVLSALLLTALLLAPGLSTVVRPSDDPQPRALLLARAGARRGPPARA